MQRLFIVLILIQAVSFSGWSKSNVDELFSYENNTFAGMNLNYRKVECGDSDKMVVLYLHGGSGQGDDNKSQMMAQAVADIYAYLKNSDRSFIMLVPQAPYGQQWMGNAIPALKAMLDKYSDNARCPVYVLGGSMGGMGTWNMLKAYPGYFTGAMPVAFDTPKDKVNKYVGTKIHIVAGGEDRRRNIGKIKSFVEKLNKSGGNVKVDVEKSWGHRQTCEWSFTPERLSWLFEQ